MVSIYLGCGGSSDFELSVPLLVVVVKKHMGIIFTFKMYEACERK